MLSNLETQLIGFCISQPQKFRIAKESGITAAHFLDKTCADCWTAMEQLAKNETEINLFSVQQAVAGNRDDEIAQIFFSAPLTQSIKYFISEIQNAFLCRNLSAMLRQLNHLAMARKEGEPVEPILEYLGKISDEVHGFAKDGADNSMAIGDIVTGKLIPDLESRIQSKTGTGVTTGFEILDTVFNSGWQPGGLYVFAGRPGMGKTTFATCAAIAAAEAGKKVLFGTIEMDSLDICVKFVSNRARVTGGRFKDADFNDEEIDRIFSGIKNIANYPVWIDDRFNGDIERLQLSAAKMRRTIGLDLIILDYVSLCEIRGKWKTQREQISAISKALKLMSRKFNCAVLALSQLNRNAGQVTRPGLEHIAESDSIGRDADGVITVYRRTEGQIETTWFNVAKNRWGKLPDFQVDADIGKNIFRQLGLNTDAFRG